MGLHFNNLRKETRRKWRRHLEGGRKDSFEVERVKLLPKQSQRTAKRLSGNW